MRVIILKDNKNMACFFIDYENLGGTALECIAAAKLKKSDEIVIFYSKNASKMSFEFHEKLENIKTKKTYILVDADVPNALDFQLSSYLGACVQNNPAQKYYIISKDRGFDCVCRFWQRRNSFVERINGFYNYANI